MSTLVTGGIFLVGAALLMLPIAAVMIWVFAAQLRGRARRHGNGNPTQ